MRNESRVLTIKKEWIVAYWTEEEIVELSRLWLEGHIARVIGEKIGFPRNAVIAKAHRIKLPKRAAPTGERGNHYAAEAALLRASRSPAPCIPKKEKALKVFEKLPVKPVRQVPRPQTPSLPGKAKGHHDTPFGIGVLSGIDFARIKAPPRGACVWPFTCSNPTDGHFCEVHRTLIRQAA